VGGAWLAPGAKLIRVADKSGGSKSRDATGPCGT